MAAAKKTLTIEQAREVYAEMRTALQERHAAVKSLARVALAYRATDAQQFDAHRKASYAAGVAFDCAREKLRGSPLFRRAGSDARKMIQGFNDAEAAAVRTVEARQHRERVEAAKR